MGIQTHCCHFPAVRAEKRNGKTSLKHSYANLFNANGRTGRSLNSAARTSPRRSLLVVRRRFFRLVVKLSADLVDGRSGRHVVRQVLRNIVVTARRAGRVLLIRDARVRRRLVATRLVILIRAVMGADLVVIPVNGPRLGTVAHQDERDLDGHVAADSAHHETHFDVIRYINGEKVALIRRALERRRRQRRR